MIRIARLLTAAIFFSAMVPLPATVLPSASRNAPVSNGPTIPPDQSLPAPLPALVSSNATQLEAIPTLWSVSLPDAGSYQPAPKHVPGVDHNSLRAARVASPTLPLGLRVLAPMFKTPPLETVVALAQPAPDPLRPAAACTVTSALDSGAGTLRACLQNVRAGDTVLFSPSVFPPAHPQTIILTSGELPYIVTDTVTIDASNAGVILNGVLLPSTSQPSGLVVQGATGVKIQGLQIKNFYRGIRLRLGAQNTLIGGNRNVGSGPVGQGNRIADCLLGITVGSSTTLSNTIVGNLLGTDLTGNAADPNGYGVAFLQNTAGNVLGGTHTPGQCDAECNLISSNNLGVYVLSAQHNHIQGNYIGVNLSGTQPLTSALYAEVYGIFLDTAAQYNTIGGETPDARNLISGNTYGIWIQDVGTDSNRIMGNYIGLDVSGTTSVGNDDGVDIIGGAANNVIGGETSGTRNLISGNRSNGIYIGDSSTTGNIVQGNYIGLDVSGTTSVGNDDGVILISGASNNVIGGETSGARNLISGNSYGVRIRDTGTIGNQIVGNYIGVDVSGESAVGNREGVYINLAASNNVIGGESTGARNLISGNRLMGIDLSGAGTMSNTVLGNYIGVNASGTAAVSNTFGVYISGGATNNVIGGESTGARNLISGNTEGIEIWGTGTTSNTVLGNYIGVNASGTAALGNTLEGVYITGGASNNVIGGESASARNLISGNEHGIKISDADTTGNRVLNNYIGVNPSGMAGLGNTLDGVYITGGAANNVIGGESTGARNLISGNGYGIDLFGVGTMSNTVSGNYIGVNVSGTAAVTNTYGIYISGGATNNVIGGESAGARNLISGNGYGIEIWGTGTTSNTILGNYIGVDVSGTAAISNKRDGIYITGGAANNVIGGKAPGARNLISGNQGYGVDIVGTGTASNAVLGNYIGVNLSGTAALSNTYGVVIISGAANNVIGGDNAGAGNLISGNTNGGIAIGGIGTVSNTVLGNYIGVNIGGTTAVSNIDGVMIYGGAANNVIGGESAGARNLISGNTNSGIWLQDVDTGGNRVLGNLIGVDVSGTTAVSNTYGVYITNGAANNVIGGESAGARNLISGNTLGGIAIVGVGADGNTVLGNYVGVNVSGILQVGNQNGVYIGGGAQGNRIGGTTSGDRNLISGNTDSGVIITDTGTTANTIVGNYLGVAADGLLPLGNSIGVQINAARANTIGISNTIAYNGGPGIEVYGANNLGNTLTRNIIYSNAGRSIVLDTPASLPSALTYAPASHVIAGAACANCQVELFASATLTPTSLVYLGTVAANVSGVFSLTLQTHPPLPFLTATATDPNGTTSELAGTLKISTDFRLYLPLVMR